MSEGKYDWRYENSITLTKEYCFTEEKPEFSYNPWRTNIVLSNYSDTILYVNEINNNKHLDYKLQYDYLFHSIKQKKRFFKKTKTFPIEDLSIIQEYYGYNPRKAKEVADLLTKEQIKILKAKLDKGGVKK